MPASGATAASVSGRSVEGGATPGDGEPWDALRSTYVHLRRVVLAVASELDLGLPELLTLKECDRAAVTPSDLAITLGLSRTGVTDLLDRLESAGWVRRAEHPTDRRATLVELSPEGRRLVRTAKARLRERLSPVRAALSPEGATALREALAQLDRAIERSLGAE